jgi:hypothetical protein
MEQLGDYSTLRRSLFMAKWQVKEKPDPTKQLHAIMNGTCERLHDCSRGN